MHNWDPIKPKDLVPVLDLPERCLYLRPDVRVIKLVWTLPDSYGFFTNPVPDICKLVFTVGVLSL